MRAISFILLAFYLWKMADVFDEMGEKLYRPMCVCIIGSWICGALSLLNALVGS